MENYDIYNDIATRGGGDIYIGVVGPVRTGKSTFITKFMENVVLPNISNKLQKQIATDEMPQSADGKTIMTTQPKFVPANAVKVQFKNKSTANVRLVDCVGYIVDGASGHTEDDKPRLIKTPWSNEEIPFDRAAEIGTRKVINDYSTIGIVVTTDGSFGEIPRANYVDAERKTVKELKALNKPFVVVLNSSTPKAVESIALAQKLEKEYGVTVLLQDVSKLDQDGIEEIMEKVLMEFPLLTFNVDLPEWMRVLPCDSPIISEFISTVKLASHNMAKMRDFNCLSNLFDESDKFETPTVKELKLDCGTVEYSVSAKEGLFYKILSEECGAEIENDCQLMSFVKTCAESSKKYEKIKNALAEAEDNGYGVVMPTLEEMNLEEPVLVKQGGKYGVKLKASAPSLHIMKVDVKTEVSPIVGTEKQGEDLVKFLMDEFEDNPGGLWETNMFGKSLHDLVNEGLSSKLTSMPKDAQNKMRSTLGKIVNENKGGILCILL